METVKKLKYSDRIALTQEGIDERQNIINSKISDYDIELAKSEVNSGLSAIKDEITKIRKKIVIEEREKINIQNNMDVLKSSNPFALQPLLNLFKDEITIDRNIEVLKKELELKEKYLKFLNELKSELF